MASTPLLGLSLPADGTTNWGTLVNTSITALLDSAVAGTTTLSTDADVTLSATTEAANQSRQAVILWKPLSGTVTRTITAPAQSKTYVVINATGGTQSIVFRGAGPTTGVTIPAGKTYMLAWNGSDFVTTGVTTVNLATDVTGILAGVNGGTGVNNTGKTITLGGNLTTSGAFNTTLTTSAATNVTLPTTGTLATLAGTETLTNKTLISPTLTTPALGTPASGNFSSGTFTWPTFNQNTSGTAAGLSVTLAVASGGTGVTTSTGTGAVVLSNNPTFPANITVNGQITVANTLKTAVASASGSGSLAPPANLCNQWNLDIFAGAVTIATPSGGPQADGQKLLLKIKDDGIARGITWNSIYRAIGVTLPTTTVAGKITYVGCIYNSIDTKWDVVAVTTQA